MCGICGFYGFEDTNTIKKMVKSISHRGPDATGIYTDGNISLGHTRLSIIDITDKGKQPMSNENKTIWITYNGEAYNYVDLRKNLNGRHNFCSNTDTEVLIHAYEEIGMDFLKKIRGMFAFAIYDSIKKKLILARDPIGKKPLYYYWDGNRFIFASEIKTILEAGIKKAIGMRGLCAYLTHQYSIGRETLFLGINKVLGGEILTFDLNTKTVSIDKYFDIKEDIINAPEDFFIKNLRKLLEESARLRTIADTPVGAFLSGGIDSTSVVALTKPMLDYDLHTFSMGFENHFSELDYAKLAAEHIDTTHHEIEIGYHDVIKELNKIAWHYDEPIGDAAIIANYFLAKEARKCVKVVVAGEAGDELFGGYDHYKKCLSAQHWFELPQIFRTPLKNIVSRSLKKEYFFRKNYPYYILNFLSQKNMYCASLDMTKSAFSNEELKQFSSCQLNFTEDQIVFPSNMRQSLNKILALDCKNMLPEKYLMKADKATMANAVEERLPLMDRDIVEFSFRISPKFKIKNGDGKYILKMAVKDIVPEKIIKRKKTGFSVPYIHWVKNEMKDVVEQKIYESELVKKLFDKEKIEMLMKNSNENEWYRNTAIVWNLFALEIWYDQFFN